MLDGEWSKWWKACGFIYIINPSQIGTRLNMFVSWKPESSAFGQLTGNAEVQASNTCLTTEPRRQWLVRIRRSGGEIWRLITQPQGTSQMFLMMVFSLAFTRHGAQDAVRQSSRMLTLIIFSLDIVTMIRGRERTWYHLPSSTAYQKNIWISVMVIWR